MTIFSGVLFLHVVSVLGIVAALSLEALMLYRLRRAESAHEVRGSLDLVPGLPVVFVGSAVVMLLTGAYLAAQISAWSEAWLKATVAALVLMVPFGAMSGRRMRAIRKMGASERAGNADLFRTLYDPTLKISLTCRMALVLGIVLLMTAKPGFVESASIVMGSLVLGLASTLLFWRGAPSPAMRASSRQ